MRKLATAICLSLMALPAYADGFSKINERNDFVSLIEGRDLTRIGIRLNVAPNGQIRGKAMGYEVTGSWAWKGGFFCRDLYWGGDDLGANCQSVEVQGNTLRFTSDRGAGDSAKLVLK